MKKIAIAFVVAATLALASCTTVLPVAATSNDMGKKVGESTTTLLFNALPISGEASIASAAKNGGIKKISSVDLKVKWLVVLTQLTAVVTGE